MEKKAKAAAKRARRSSRKESNSSESTGTLNVEGGLPDEEPETRSESN